MAGSALAFAAIAAPSRGFAAADDPDARLRLALDRLAALETPSAKLAAIADIPTENLSHSAQLDLLCVRQGLAVDVQIAMREAASDQAGIGSSPGGSVLYSLLLERQLGERASPAGVHLTFLTHWQLLARRASALFDRLGIDTGSVGANFVALFNDPRWHYPDSSSGRDKAVADMNAVLDRARGKVEAQVGAVPEYCLAVRARRMSPSDEATGRGGYRIVGSPDTAGAYFVDLSDIARRPSWSLRSVVHHELLPGHMIQMPIARAARPHPLRLEYTPAVTEGWAIYAEMLAAGEDDFAGDAAAELGYLHWILFRVGRGLADTGIHYAGWSRQKALSVLRETQGVPAFFAPFEKDVDRIRLAPGIRAAEAMTALRYNDLAQSAKASGGAEAMRQVNRIILEAGPKTLSMVAAAKNKITN